MERKELYVCVCAKGACECRWDETGGRVSEER